MSGGALDYAYGRIERLATEVERLAQTPLHRAFAEHLGKVASALHDLEWVLSGDYNPGNEVESIRAVINDGLELQYLIEDAKRSYKNLGDLLETLDRD